MRLKFTPCGTAFCHLHAHTPLSSLHTLHTVWCSSLSSHAHGVALPSILLCTQCSAALYLSCTWCGMALYPLVCMICSLLSSHADNVAGHCMICQESVSLKQALPEGGRCKLIVLPPKGKHKYGATLQCNLHKGKHAEAMEPAQGQTCRGNVAKV